MTLARRRWWFPFDGRGPFLEYCLVAWHLALIPSIALAGLAYLAFSSTGADVSASPVFFGTVWSFYVFSLGYLAWRPVSYKHALGAAAVPHALVNSSALLMQFFAHN